ncbi:MAG TPA: hypothetical protein VGH28_22525 [Polyangiaceae bacterium]|jgi:hypothetical protein
MSTTIAKLLDALAASKQVSIERDEPIKDVAAFAKRIKPHFGKITWTPPATYASALTTWGPFRAENEDGKGFTLLGPDELRETNEDLVHMPEGVSRDEGVDLSTNHLVGFAEASGEAIWCFDVTQGKGGDYPVYYHHQDEPRARVLATGAWDSPKDAAPDFDSFAQWLETMVVALTAKKPPGWLEDLGSPHERFTKRRLALK